MRPGIPAARPRSRKKAEKQMKAAQVLKQQQRSDIRFLIYGEKKKKASLEAFAAEQGLPVVFKGKVEKKYVPYILSKADVNVINVKNTGLTKYGCSWNKLFEYIASEKPILCNFPQNNDLINTHHLGISEHFDSSESYAQRIAQLVDLTTEEKNAIALKANEVKRVYDYQHLTARLEQLFKTLLEEV